MAPPWWLPLATWVGWRVPEEWRAHAAVEIARPGWALGAAVATGLQLVVFYAGLSAALLGATRGNDDDVALGLSFGLGSLLAALALSPVFLPDRMRDRALRRQWVDAHGRPEPPQSWWADRSNPSRMTLVVLPIALLVPVGVAVDLDPCGTPTADERLALRRALAPMPVESVGVLRDGPVAAVAVRVRIQGEATVEGTLLLHAGRVVGALDAVGATIAPSVPSASAISPGDAGACVAAAGGGG